MAVVEADLLGRGIFGVQDIGLDVQSIGGLDEHAAKLATAEDSHLGRVPHIVSEEKRTGEECRRWSHIPRNCPSSKIRGESHDTIDKANAANKR